MRLEWFGHKPRPAMNLVNWNKAGLNWASVSVNTHSPDSVALDFIWQAVLMRWLFVLEKEK